MRDEAALVACYDEILIAYPTLMGAWGQRVGLSMGQMHAAIRGMLDRERHGDLRATAALDQFQTAMNAWQALECAWPCREGATN